MNINIKTDLWHYLASSERPIVMYGMGNGADKILAVCEQYGIEISDFFASDGFVRGHSFHGKTVISYSAMKGKYEGQNPIVLLSFASSLPDVMALFRKVGEECELYAPDVPVFGETLFTIELFEENRARFEKVYEMLADEESKRIYKNIICYKLTGDVKYLWDSESDKQAVYEKILDCKNISRYVDLGAYNGDTIREMLHFNPNLQSAIALEPDARNFRKLNEYAQTLENIDIKCINAGAWNENTTLLFDASGNRNAGIVSKGNIVSKIKEVNVISVDEVLNGAKVDYIKYDVEGSEREALLGSAETIKTLSPKLLVSLYHRSEDLFALPELVKELNSDYSLYLRRFPYIPAWDLNLYAIKK
ncbi:MAG: FkbM family methyltransferase [Clostridia bacterium]|nr:FkbM family methyltransferase [Clostridia bacterium]